MGQPKTKMMGIKECVSNGSQTEFSIEHICSQAVSKTTAAHEQCETVIHIANNQVFSSK